MGSIELRNVTKNFGDFMIDDVSFYAESGDYLIIFGPSGAGKSLILELIAGVHLPDSGKIFVDGIDVTYFPPEKRGLSIVYQDYMLFPHMTGYENIAYGLKVRGYSAEEIERRVNEVAEKLNIKHVLNKKPYQMSGGEQQRVAIARALVIEPKALLLDEPTSNLDISLKSSVRKMLREINDEGVTIIHVTHDIGEALSLGKNIVVIKSGKVRVASKISELIEHATKDPEIASILGIFNVFEGIYDIKEKGPIVRVKDVEINVLFDYEVGKKARIHIPPETISIFTKEPVDTSMLNILYGTVEDYYLHGIFVDVYIKVGAISVVSRISRNSFESLDIRPQKEVYIGFKSSSVRLIS